MSEPEPPGEPPPPAAPTPARPFYVSALKAILVFAFGFAAAAAVLRIQERVHSREEFQVDLSRARVTGPGWLPAGEAKALQERAASSGKAPIRRVGLPEEVAARLAGDPRVKSVLGARRLHPDRIEVLLELRRPVALVECGKVLAAVDAEGIRVPGDYATRPLPRIRGAGVALPEPGHSFGRAVKEGASVAAAIPEDLSAALDLAVVDVSGVEKGTGVVLRPKADPKAKNPSSVEWGRAPAAEDAALDPPAGEKVARLRLAATRFPGLKGLKTVRLGFDDLVVVPL